MVSFFVLKVQYGYSWKINMIKCAEIILFTILSPLAMSLSMYSDIDNQSSKRTSSWNASDVERNLSEWTFKNCVVQIHIGASTTKLYFMMFQIVAPQKSKDCGDSTSKKRHFTLFSQSFIPHNHGTPTDS